MKDGEKGDGTEVAILPDWHTYTDTKHALIWKKNDDRIRSE